MIKNDSNVFLIISIGLIAIVSGCIGGQDSKVSETAKPIPTVQTTAIQTAVQTAGYQIQVTEAKNLQGCVFKKMQMTPCTLVSIEFSNNNKESINFYLNKEAIVTNDGKQLVGIIDDRGTSINPTCNFPHPSFELFPGARKNIDICYPSVGEQDNPILHIGVLINNKPGTDIRSAEQKEFKFDLTPYLPIIIK